MLKNGSRLHKPVWLRRGTQLLKAKTMAFASVALKSFSTSETHSRRLYRYMRTLEHPVHVDLRRDGNPVIKQDSAQSAHEIQSQAMLWGSHKEMR
jgi:hypothetical protein